jgi:deoxyuridine 5'-triphosphate nucleotidohydrolase
MRVRTFKMRENAKLPVRAHTTDAGMDFFFAPKDNAPLLVHPGHSCLLETGVKVEVPEGHMLQIMNKSGIASKRSIVTGACVVDRGYDGEIFVNLHNIGRETQICEPGTKIAQGVFVRISTPSLLEIEEDKIYESETDRGTGGFGSTGDV